MGERLGDVDLSRRLLGLGPRLVDRLQPLSDCEVFNSPFEVTCPVIIKWFGPEGLSSTPRIIKFFFTEEDLTFNMLTTYFGSLEFPEKLSPFEGLSATLTIIATINETARVLGKDLLHLARANEGTRSFFQRFRRSGLYDFCSERGRIVQKPIVSNGLEHYVCRYPVKDIDLVLGEFIIDKAVGQIIRTREEGMEKYGLLPGY